MIKTNKSITAENRTKRTKSQKMKKNLIKSKYKPPSTRNRKTKKELIQKKKKDTAKKKTVQGVKKKNQEKKNTRRHNPKDLTKKKNSRSSVGKVKQNKKPVLPEMKKSKDKRVIPDSWPKIEGYVPAEVVKMARKVLSQYDMKVKDMLVVATKPKKGGAIWQVKTNKGIYSLKLLHRRPTRSLFSIGAQDYLVKNKARVPALVPAKSGQLYVEMGNRLWIVSKWIKSLTRVSEDLKGAKKLCEGLGEFHTISRGYIPPTGSEYVTRLNRWPDYYGKIITKFGWFRALGQAYSDTPAGPVLLSALEIYDKQAREALSRLQESPYAELVARGERYWGLAHQDYGWGNAQLGPGGIWVIDLDGVIYDLPIRDLRKLISSVTEDLGKWDLKWIKGMINAYHKKYPIERKLYEVLLIDLAMPNEFYKFIKKMVYDPESFLNNEVKSELKKMIKMEDGKQQVLKELSDWKVGQE